MARAQLTILRFILFFSFISIVFDFGAQSSCPVNIGFEQGNFAGWNCLDGKVDTKGRNQYERQRPYQRKTYALQKRIATGKGYFWWISGELSERQRLFDEAWQ